MEPASPPKRMTRARAAAKATESSAAKVTSKAATASKTKAVRKPTSATTTTTASKRKTRSDDVDDNLVGNDDGVEQLPEAAVAKAVRSRGRPKKVVDEPAQDIVVAAAPRARGRPKKTAEPAEEATTKPARTNRTRKTQPDETEPGQEKKPARARTTATTTLKPALKSAMKKTVTFVEPEKENMVPTTAPKTKTTTEAAETAANGLRGRPVRRPAATTTTRASRTAKSATNAEPAEKPRPLSPRKLSQMDLNGADSEDELAGDDKYTLKPMMRNPIKPPVSHSKVTAPAPVSAPVEVDSEDIMSSTNDTAPHPLISSPARRAPASPFKDIMKSPPKRIQPAPSLSLPSDQLGDYAPPKNFKASLLQSPAKRPQSPMKGLSGQEPSASASASTAPPFQRSLFSSPAKRRMSPMKHLASATKPENFGQPEPAVLEADIPANPVPLQEAEAHEDMDEENIPDSADVESESEEHEMELAEVPLALHFPGRLSAVLPRHADPAFKDIFGVQTDVEAAGEPMNLDTPYSSKKHSGLVVASMSTATPKPAVPMYGLRDKDLDTYIKEDSDSEDEITLPKRTIASSYAQTPTTPGMTGSFRTPSKQQFSGQESAGRGTAKRARVDDRYGFTPLVNQLNCWTAGASPLKSGISARAMQAEEGATLVTMAPVESPAAERSLVGNTFFEDAMLGHGDAAASTDVDQSVCTVNAAALENGGGADALEEPDFSDISITDEDVALAEEAQEMSLMGGAHADESVNQVADDTLSEASQEYGDENAVPIDPALQDLAVPPVTPQRMLHREFSTVSKVPLKPADDSTPRPKMRKRSHSISRLPVQRPTQGLTRNATVISYSPVKRRDEENLEVSAGDERAESLPPMTPTKSEAGWSTIGTPARTPRSDLNPALLRGAVVFVDVHTTEGADASGIFVELLTQMGARCVKSWAWNPSTASSSEDNTSKVGITHVVFKDGGKRTMEKVRETGGVVQCVGVSWVLDCERENEWLDEAPYYIDTSLVPRGGARRRKSMEPKALANMNGTLVQTPSRVGNGSSARDCQSAPNTPINRRRESGLWVHTPEDDADHDEMESHGLEPSEWENALLMPVPKTPAPETIARYAANVTPATPSTGSVDNEDSPLDKEALAARTCPPKANAFQDYGAGLLARDKDQGVLMRLMAARRKSLQFAPKIASPLSKAWH